MVLEMGMKHASLGAWACRCMVAKLRSMTDAGGSSAPSQAAMSERMAMQCALALFISHLHFTASSLPGDFHPLRDPCLAVRPHALSAIRSGWSLQQVTWLDEVGALLPQIRSCFFKSLPLASWVCSFLRAMSTLHQAHVTCIAFQN